MALMFMDGFDHYNIADIGKKWTAAGFYGSAVMDTGRINGQSFKSTASGGGSYELWQSMPSAEAVGGLGFAFKTTNNDCVNGYFAYVRHANGQAQLGLKCTAGTVSICQDGTSTALATGGTISNNAWHYIEWTWTIHASAGTSTVWIDGVEVCTFPSSRTKNASATDATWIQIAMFGAATVQPGWTSNGVICWLDDLYILSGASGLTGPLGDVTVKTLYPTDNGTTNNGTASTGDNHSCVDETLADATDYVTHDTVGDIDTFPVTAVAAGTSIKGVQVVIMAKKSDDGSSGLTAEVYHDASNHAHPTPQGLNTTDVFKSFIYPLDPDGAAWTDTSFNACEFGVEKTL